MIAADDLLETFAATHDFDDEPAGLGISLVFIDEIALFQSHEIGSLVRMTATTPFAVDIPLHAEVRLPEAHATAPDGVRQPAINFASEITTGR